MFVRTSVVKSIGEISWRIVDEGRVRKFPPTSGYDPDMRRSQVTRRADEKSAKRTRRRKVENEARERERERERVLYGRLPFEKCSLISVRHIFPLSLIRETISTGSERKRERERGGDAWPARRIQPRKPSLSRIRVSVGIGGFQYGRNAGTARWRTLCPPSSSPQG